MDFKFYAVTPVGQTSPSGDTIVARFTVEVAPGIAARLALVRSARDGADLIWSARACGEPVVEVSRARRAELAAAVRRELAAIRSALVEAA